MCIYQQIGVSVRTAQAGRQAAPRNAWWPVPSLSKRPGALKRPLQASAGTQAELVSEHFSLFRLFSICLGKYGHRPSPSPCSC